MNNIIEGLYKEKNSQNLNVIYDIWRSTENELMIDEWELMNNNNNKDIYEYSSTKTLKYYLDDIKLEKLNEYDYKLIDNTHLKISRIYTWEDLKELLKDKDTSYDKDIIIIKVNGINSFCIYKNGDIRVYIIACDEVLAENLANSNNIEDKEIGTLIVENRTIYQLIEICKNLGFIN